MASGSSSELKFRRARKHLSELEGLLRAYYEAEPFEVYQDADPYSGPLTYRVRVKVDVPPEIALVVGDVVHNARSALDHVACRLVEAGHGSTDHVSFPAGQNEIKFRQAVRDRLRKAPEAAKSAVAKLAVYPGGDDKLWSLHRLDVDDKHKLLIPVASSHQTVNLHLGWKDIQLGPLALPLAEPTFPVVDGSALLVINEQPRFNKGTSDLVQDHSFGFDLALPPGSMASARPVPVLAGLEGLVDRAETVAQLLLATVN